MNKFIFRPGTQPDIVSINTIFNWHSENGFSTFQEPTTIEDRKKWFSRFDGKRRALFVAESDEKVIGLACSFDYRDGGVFSNTLETSVYLHPEYMGGGLGTKLYKSLFDHLEKQEDVHRVVVGIALPNEGSIGLHRKFGFEDIGVFDEYAFYKGEYRSSLWMQKRMN